MPWSTLSEDVWKHILVHIPLAQRLGSCSRVSKALYRAAAAATQHIELDQGEARVQRLTGLCQWLLQHGQHLTSLDLSGPGGTLTQLPCPNLRELDLRDMQVQLSGSSTQPGVLHSCTRLTKLLLECCQFAGGHSSLAALSALVRLQRLAMTVDVSESTDDGVLPSTVLQHLTQLTSLYLGSGGQLLNADSLQHISCLVNLQELGLCDNTITLSPSTTPGLSRLTALRELTLQHVEIDASFLQVIQQDYTQLQGLELQDVAIISAGDAAALHSLLGRLQQLHFLRLIELEYEWPAATTAYSSLTASSHLTRLDLDIDNLPPGIWPHVFPPDRQLPALQELTLGSFEDVEKEDDVEEEEDEPGPPPLAALGTDDISCMMRCCPGLHRISIDVQPDTQLADLAKATGLTCLWATGLHAEGFESLGVLSGLVSLQELSVDLGGPISPQDLLRLTTLTGLTAMCINPANVPEFEGAVDVDVDLTQECHPGMPRDPPVWLELLKHCGKFSECHPLMFDSMGQQLAAQQQQIAELQAQQRHTSELQEQLAATRAQAAASQAAAASAAAEAGELRGRLQAVEGQVQQLLQAMPLPRG